MLIYLDQWIVTLHRHSHKMKTSMNQGLSRMFYFFIMLHCVHSSIFSRISLYSEAIVKGNETKLEIIMRKYCRGNDMHMFSDCMMRKQVYEPKKHKTDINWNWPDFWKGMLCVEMMSYQKRLIVSDIIIISSCTLNGYCKSEKKNETWFDLRNSWVSRSRYQDYWVGGNNLDDTLIETKLFTFVKTKCVTFAAKYLPISLLFLKFFIVLP